MFSIKKLVSILIFFNFLFIPNFHGQINILDSPVNYDRCRIITLLDGSYLLLTLNTCFFLNQSLTFEITQLYTHKEFFFDFSIFMKIVQIPDSNRFILYGYSPYTLLAIVNSECEIEFPDTFSVTPIYYEVLIDGMFLKEEENIFLMVYHKKEDNAMNIVEFAYYNIQTKILKKNSITVQDDLTEISIISCIEYISYHILCAYKISEGFRTIMFNIEHYEEISNYPIAYEGVEEFVITSPQPQNVQMIIEYGLFFYKLNDIVIFCYNGLGLYCKKLQNYPIVKSDFYTIISRCIYTYLIYATGDKDLQVFCQSTYGYGFTIAKVYNELELNSQDNQTRETRFLNPIRAEYLSNAYINENTYLILLSDAERGCYFYFNYPTCESQYFPYTRNNIYNIDLISNVKDPTFSIDQLIIIFLKKPQYGKLLFTGTDTEVELFNQYSLVNNQFQFASPDDDINFIGNKLDINYVIRNQHSFTSPICVYSLYSCYERCKTCSQGGDNNFHHCDICNDGYYKIETITGNCITPDEVPPHFYYDYKTKTYIQCYRTCDTCVSKGNYNNNKCTSCKSNTIQNPKFEGNCVYPCADNQNWYIDLKTDEYLCSQPNDSCPVNYIYYNPQSRECIIDCKILNKKFYNFECIDECPDGLWDNDSYCANDCMNYFYKDETHFKCVNCALQDMYLYHGECILKKDRPNRTFVSNVKYGVLEDCYSKIDINSNQMLTHYNDYQTECITKCPDNYYYTEESTCAKCYDSCLSCSSVGNIDNQNCLECKEGFMLNPYKNGICIEKCSKYWIYNISTQGIECVDYCDNGLFLNEENNECLNSCGNLFEYDKYCINKCPDGYILYNGKCIDEKKSPLEREDNFDNILDILNGDLNNIVDNLDDISSNTITKDNKTLQLYNTDNIDVTIKDAFDKNLSIIDFSNCESKIREQMNLPTDEDIYILKIDENVNNKPTTSFKAYYSDGKEINISAICSDIKIDVSIPLFLPEEVIKLSEQGIDIYNSSDPFFNNICIAYSENGKDVPIDARRKSIYKSDALCKDNCTYNGINLTTSRANCSCDADILEKKETKESNESSEFSLIDDNDLLSTAFKLMNSNSFAMLKCYKTAFDTKQLLHNLGFWIFIYVCIIELIIGICGIFIGYDKLLAYLNKFTKDNSTSSVKPHPTKRYFSNSSSPMNTETNNSKLIPSKSRKFYYRTPIQRGNFVNRRLIYSNREINERSSPCKKSEGKISIFESTNFKSQRSLKERPSVLSLRDANSDDIISHSKESFEKFANEEIPTHQKHESGGYIKEERNRLMSEYNIGTNNNILPIKVYKKVNKREFNRDKEIRINEEEGTNKSIKSISRNRNKSNDESNSNSMNSDMSYQNIDDMEFEEAMLKDNRTFCSIYWSFLSHHQMILSVFFNKNPFSPYLIRLYLCLFTMSLFFIFNIILYKDEYISDRYYSDEDGKITIKYIFQKEISKCIYASFIVNLMNMIIAFIFSHYELNKTIRLEGNKGITFLIECNKSLKKTKRRFAISLLVIYIFLLFFWYYATVFCAIYRNTQMIWIQESLITLALNNMASICLLLLSALMRYIGNKMKSFIFFKISCVLSDFS